VTAEAAFWNDLAERYARQPLANPGAFERKIEITRSRMKPTDVVLDIGCGTGSLALRLASGAATIHGLDLSSEMVRVARGKAQAEGAANVSFHVDSFDSCELFPPASLDGVCAYSLLHLVEDLPATLEHIHRLLRPGGFFVSSTVCLGESWVPYRPILEVMRWLGKAPRVRMLRKRELEDELRRAGFDRLEQPEVGAESTIAFIVAEKPRAPA
jgi:2-polyprenyl-3-methyl-5-hydroxy-6-metoxy-1,4-benzoquinol methylase